jgi:putative membrane protein
MFRTSRLVRSSGRESANKRLDFGILRTSNGGISQGIAAIFYAIVAMIFSEYAMRYLKWILRVAFFLSLFGFAVKNDQPITLYYFFGYEWQSTLVMVLLIFFAAGTVIGILAMFANVLQKSREISVLKREILATNKLVDIGEKPQEIK